MKPIKKPAGTGLVTTSHSLYFKAKIKQVVVLLACYGLLTLAMADWVIASKGLNDE